MQLKKGISIALILLILCIFHFEPSEQGLYPSVKLLKRLGLLNQRQDKHQASIHTAHHQTIINQPVEQPDNFGIIDKDDLKQHQDDEHESIVQLVDNEGDEAIHVSSSSTMSLHDRIRHYVRVGKLIRGVNMLLDLGEFFRTYLE
jgi:hypothetical protein